MSNRKYNSWLQQQRRKHNVDKVMSILREGPKTFTEIVAGPQKAGNRRKAAWMSRQTASVILGSLLKQDTIEKVVDKDRTVYVLTEVGYRSYADKAPWPINYELFDIQSRNGMYIRNWSKLLKGVTFHIAADDDFDEYFGPDLNIIELALLDKAVQGIGSNEMKFHRKSESAIQSSHPSKGIFSIEVDCRLISDQLRRVIAFRDDIKNGSDIFSDTELGFGEAVDKFDLLADYYNFANFLDDSVYKAKSRTYFANLTENQIKALDPNIDPDALNLFVRDIENDIDPMEDRLLKNKLSNKRKLVWAVMLRYMRIANIVRYADTEFKRKLTEFSNTQNNIEQQRVLASLDRKRRGTK